MEVNMRATTERKFAIFLALSLLVMTTLACGQTSSPTSTQVVKTATPTGGAAEDQPTKATAPQQATNVPATTSAPTSAPKATLAPTSTSIPTAIPPTKTPTSPTTAPNVPPLEILSHQNYTDGEWFHIVGEVRNNTNAAMEYVKIVATLYDSNNKVVGTDFAYTELDIILPGGKSPFEIGTDEWAGVITYKVQVEGREGSLPRQDLVILSHESYKDDQWLHVRGEVQNTGTTPAEYVKLVVTLYDASGNVVATDFGYTTLDTIPVGGTSPFETGTDYWPDFDHYEIQIQGR